MAMEQSILKSTKKILGIAPTISHFDVDVITHINAALATLTQLGIGSDVGLFIEDDSVVWSDIGLSPLQLNMVKSYVYLKTRMLFDPPATSFHIAAMNEQLNELAWRLNFDREFVETSSPATPDVQNPVFDGGSA